MRHIILFVAVAAVAEVLLLWMLGGTGKLRNVEYRLGHADHTYTRLREADTTHGVDVLFMGSSHSYRTFDPRMYPEMKVMNMGSSNQTPIQTEALLHRYLKTLSPRLVVIEVHPDIMMYDGVESTLYLLCNSRPSWEMVPAVVRSHNAKVYCTAVYAMLHNGLGRAFAEYEEPADIAGNVYVQGGYVERPMEHYAPQAHPRQTIRPLKNQRAALQRCVEYLKRQGVPYVLVEVPDTKVLMDSYDNLDEFQREMSAYGPFVGKRVAALDDSLHYYDDSHLNQRGVEVYNEMLRDSVIKPILDRI